MSENQLTVYQQDRGIKPSFHDGLTSQKTYLVVAAYQEQGKNQAYNCICIRPVGEYYRVHAYPDFNHFGLTMEHNTYHRPADINGRYGYEGAHLQEKDIADMLAVLRFKRELMVLPQEHDPFELAQLGYAPGRAVAVAYSG